MASMSKANLVEKIYEYGLGYTKEELRTFVVGLCTIIEKELCKGEDVRLSRFGSFEVVDKVARPGRNPKTKEEVIIARRKSIRVQASPKLNAYIHNGENDVQ